MLARWVNQFSRLTARISMFSAYLIRECCRRLLFQSLFRARERKGVACHIFLFDRREIFSDQRFDSSTLGVPSKQSVYARHFIVTWVNYANPVGLTSA